MSAAKEKLETVLLESLRMGFQAPECLDEEVVQDAAGKLARGEAFEPLKVCLDEGAMYLTDGFHRVEAARRAGVGSLVASVYEGSIAQLESQYLAALAQALEDNRRWAADNLPQRAK